MVEVAAGEEVVVVQALEEMAGLPAVAFSRLPVLRHHVPGHYPSRPQKTNFPKIAQNNVNFFFCQAQPCIDEYYREEKKIEKVEEKNKNLNWH